MVSLRSKVDRIQVWTRNKDDVEKLNGIGKRLVKLLDISDADNIGLEFQVGLFSSLSHLISSDIVRPNSTTPTIDPFQTNSSRSNPSLLLRSAPHSSLVVEGKTDRRAMSKVVRQVSVSVLPVVLALVVHSGILVWVWDRVVRGWVEQGGKPKLGETEGE